MTKFNPIYTIRKATLSDIMHFHEAVSSINDTQLNEYDFDSVFKLKMKQKQNYLVVLMDQDDKFAGCSVFGQKIDINDLHSYYEIELFYIKPKYRKHLGAEVLYKEIEKIVAIKKGHKITISCLLNATINQRFYAKRGFKLVKKCYVKTNI